MSGWLPGPGQLHITHTPLQHRSPINPAAPRKAPGPGQTHQLATHRNSVYQRQGVLIAHGYHITHDGIMGPQTAAAWAAYQNGTHPAAWNGGSHHSNTARTGSGGGGGGSRMGGGGHGGSGGGGGGHQGGGMGGLGNPSKNAKAMTDLQYGSLLQALHSNISNLTGQNKQNLSDIHDWFGHAQDIAQASGQADQAAGTTAQGQNTQDFNGLLDALGGGTQAAPMVGGMHMADQTLLQALSANQQGFDNTFKSNLGAESAQASQNQMNTGDQAVQDLQDKLTQAIADKGNAGVVNLATAREQRLQMMAELQNMSLAGKQFNLNQALGLADLKNKNLQNSAFAKQLKQTTNGGRTPWNKIGTGDRLKLQQSLMPVMYGPNHEMNLNPKQAWERAANQLRVAGYNTKNIPGLRSWLSQSWLSYVGDWNRKHPDHKYTPEANGTPFANW